MPVKSSDMSDDECITAAMLLGMEWLPLKAFGDITLTAGRWYDPNETRVRFGRWAPNQADASRVFLKQRGIIEYNIAPHVTIAP